jgi:hypothetical protein
MRPTAYFSVLVVLMSAAACGSSPPPAAKSPAPTTPEGATAGQPPDSRANRPLSHEECEQLGQSITDTCHSNNTRIATIEGWCSEVISGVSAGSWVGDCEKHIKYVDAVCFASTDNVRAMMDCDSAVSR